MYTQFFGLSQEPFSIAPDPRALYMSESHREALAHLLYGIRGGGGFVVLTGEIGAGKTTICRCLLEQIPPHCKVAYIFNPRLSVLELLVTVCDEFGVRVEHPGRAVPSVKDCIDPLNRYLLDSHGRGEQNILIIDEAQSLSADVLEQLRLLTNLETNQRKLLQIILIGQPELRVLLASPGLEQLAQRVIARFHLGALSAAESWAYVGHRMAVAAGAGAVMPFDEAGVARIHRLARGIPRRINLLCDRALLGAFAEGKARVTRTIIEKAAREIQMFDQGRLPRLFVASAVLAGLALAALIAIFQWLPASLEDPAVLASLTAPLPEGFTASAVSQAPLTLTAPPAGDEPAVAWQQLAELWKLPELKGEPCAAAALAAGLQCYRGTGGLTEIRQLGRPAVLTLQDQPGRKSYVVLSALNAEQAFVHTGGKGVAIGWLALAQVWRGEFVTWWRVPPGYRSGAADGGVPPAWLAAQLAQLTRQDAAAQAGSASSVQDTLRRFQRIQGLTPDGVPGPRTLMQINRLVGVDEPRLPERAQ